MEGKKEISMMLKLAVVLRLIILVLGVSLASSCRVLLCPENSFPKNSFHLTSRSLAFTGSIE